MLTSNKVIKYSENVVQLFPGIYESISNSYLQNIIFYMINTKTRQSVNLRNWLKKIMDQPTCESVKAALLQIPDSSDPDEQVNLCLNWVVANIKYIPDDYKWSMLDHWSTPEETLISEVTTKKGTYYGPKTGDCEDGAILLYELCRRKGVPENRLLVLCGDVKGGGHCWLAYKPKLYPLNFVFLDWCYFTDLNTVDYKNKFYVNPLNKVFEFKSDNETEILSKYFSVWYGFSEMVNITNFKNKNT